MRNHEPFNTTSRYCGIVNHHKIEIKCGHKLNSEFKFDATFDGALNTPPQIPILTINSDVCSPLNGQK